MIKKKELAENGNELKHTYWTGYELGYLKGKLYEIQREIDEIEFENDIGEHKNHEDNVYFLLPHKTPNKPFILHGNKELEYWYQIGDVMPGDLIYLGKFLKEKKRYV